MSSHHDLSRRGFLSAAVALPTIVPGTVLGLNGAVAPSDRITLGVIGAGARSMFVTSQFLQQPDVQILAVCDCFADRRRAAKQAADDYNGNEDCAAYRFHEQILERDDIDAVLIATGDRWHAVLSILAARAGKDVYSEKPFCLTVAEGRALVDTMKRYGTVWQCGSQRKSTPGYGFVVDVVRSGKIGKLHTITTSFGDAGTESYGGIAWRDNGLPVPETEPDPEVFDYDRWLGQAPWAPYSSLRVKLWRSNWDTGAGPIADMGAHYFEFAQWGRGNELSGPVEYEGEGVFRHDEKGINNIPYFYHVRARYSDGLRLLIDAAPKGVRFDGDDGWIRLSDEGEITVDPPSLLGDAKPPDGSWKVIVPHIRNFLDCVKSRKLTASHPEVAQRSHTLIHCTNICLRLGRKVRWNPETERFINDDEANSMLSRTMRVPWNV